MRLVFRRRREERKALRIARLLCELDEHAALTRPKARRKVSVGALKA
jgi:hypothetical protein